MKPLSIVLFELIFSAFFGFGMSGLGIYLCLKFSSWARTVGILMLIAGAASLLYSVREVMSLLEPHLCLAFSSRR